MSYSFLMYIVSLEESDWKLMEARFLGKPLVSIKDFPYFSVGSL